MKKIFFAIACLFGAVSVIAQDRLFIDDFAVDSGGEVTVKVNLTNPDNVISAVQFDLFLPAGLEVATNSNGKYMFTLNNGETARVYDHTCSVALYENGAYRFVISSMSSTQIHGTQGELLSVTLKAAEGFKGGTGSIENIVLVKPDGEKLTTAKATFSVSSNSGEIAEPKVNRLSVADFTTKAGGQVEVKVNLTNSEDVISAVQFDLFLPAGLEVAANSNGKYMFTLNNNEDTGRLADHTCSAALYENGAYRFVISSMSSTQIYGTEGELLTVTLKAAEGFKGGTGSIENIVLVKPNGEKMSAEKATFRVTSEVVVPTGIDGTLLEYGTTAIPWTADRLAQWTAGGSPTIGDGYVGTSGTNESYATSLVVTPATNAIVKVQAVWRGRSNVGRLFSLGNCSYFRFGNIVVAQNDQNRQHGYTFNGLGDVANVTTFAAGNYRVDIADCAWLLIDMEINTANNTLTSFSVRSEDGATTYASASNVILSAPDYSTVAFGYQRGGTVNFANAEQLKWVKVTQTTQTVQTATYIVRYVCDGVDIKDAVTRTGIVGDEIVFSRDDKADVYAADASKKYIYDAEHKGGGIVADGVVVTLFFREAAKYTWTARSNVGDFRASGVTFEGDPARVLYPCYVLADGVLWSKEPVDRTYAITYDVTEDNQEFILDYSASNIPAIFYSEVEDIPGMSHYADGNAAARSSQCSVGYSASTRTLITTLPRGKYNLVASFYSPRSTGGNYSFYTDNRKVWELRTNDANATLGMQEIVLAKESNALYLGKGSFEVAVDYIYIQQLEVTDEELAAAAQADADADASFENARTALGDAIAVAKAQDVSKATADAAQALADAIATAEAVLNDGDATIAMLTDARTALEAAVEAFQKAVGEPTNPDETVVEIRYTFDDNTQPALQEGVRVLFDYGHTSVITNTPFLNLYSSENGRSGAVTIPLADTDLSKSAWTLSFEWAGNGGCNNFMGHILLAGEFANLFDITDASNWNDTVTVAYGESGKVTLPVPGCNRSYRFTANTADLYNTADYWHHFVITGSSAGVRMTITNSATGAVLVSDAILSETNVSPAYLSVNPSCGGAVALDELTLTYTKVDKPTLEAPVITHESNVVIITAADDATVYYTLDGTTPDSIRGTRYTGPFFVDHNGTVKAVAQRSGYFDSPVSTLTVDWFKVNPVTFSPEGNVLTMATTTPQASIRYYILSTQDTGGAVAAPDTLLYQQPITLTEACVVTAFAVREGWANSIATTFPFTPGDATLAAPAITHEGNLIQIFAGEGVTVFYTLNGTTPDSINGTRYTEPFAVDRNGEVKAVAVRSGYFDSPVATIVVDWFNVAAPTFSLDGMVLTISCATERATIYYGIGNETTPSLLYEGSVTLTSNAVVRAIAYREGYNDSGIVEFLPTIPVIDPVEIVYNGRYLKLKCEAGVQIHYTTDGSEPTEHSDLYTDSIEPNRLYVVKAIAVRQGFLCSPVSTRNINYYYDGSKALLGEGGLLAKAFEWCGAAQVKRLALVGIVDATDLATVRSLPALEDLDMERSGVTDLGDALAGSRFVVFRSPNLERVKPGMLADCPNLAAVVWNSTHFALTADAFGSTLNPNLLVYVQNDGMKPAGISNVVVGEEAERITLGDASGGYANFFCPIPFKAKEISYTRDFTLTTEQGKAQGWEAIALPFTVQAITHADKGAMAPFHSEQTGVKNFWLMGMAESGLTASPLIEAHKPYVISMPNSDKYDEMYNLNGRVTFSAANVDMTVTEPVSMKYGDVTLVPAFLRVERSADVYALNTEVYEGNPAGSVFVENLRDVRPFEAYTLHANGTRGIIALGDLADGTLGIGDVPVYSTGRNGRVRVYNMAGLPVAEGSWPQLKKKLPKGVYIINGTKTIVK